MYCNDKVVRLCVIRRNFGRNREIILNVDILLVGLRDWEHRAEGKKPKVDLLYVYSESQMDELKKSVGFNSEILPDSVKQEDDNIIFTHNIDDDEDLIVQEQKQKNKNSSSENNKIMDIDFDDI